ncbi:MAG: phospho-sugar mutase [Clostridiales bacterium]|nr:phospho-sugar mutase [Clostridiales bacterium]
MDSMFEAKKWSTDEFFDENTREAARLTMNDENDMLAAFGSELSFGTGGLRGILGVGTARMNRYTVARATLGLAKYLISNKQEPSVAIAYDSRHGSVEFTLVAAQVLAKQGVKVYVFPTLVPTPMLSYAVRTLGADAGIMVTASHNPAEYNGYKVYGDDGCQITDHAADEITAQISQLSYTDAQLMDEDEARNKQLIVDIQDDVNKSFDQACLFCRPDPSVCTGIKVVYTPLHGTGLVPVREVLGHMQGVTVIELTEQCEPNGDFPTCKKPNPELDETLSMGIARARVEEADILLATDPDCDRVGVAVRTPAGDYHRLSGNEVGLLLMDYILRTRRSQGTLLNDAVVVKTIVTSDLAFPIAKAYGARIKEVLTGFKYIGEVIGELEKAGKEANYVFGFEESCGYLAGTHVRDKDGVMACMLIAEMTQSLKSSGLTVFEALENLYTAYGHMGTALMNYDIAGVIPMEKMQQTMARMRGAVPQTLAGQRITCIKDYLKSIDGLPQSNVLSYETENGLKAIVRPSGTEPKVKIYLSARGTSSEEAQKLIEMMKDDANMWMDVQ